MFPFPVGGLPETLSVFEVVCGLFEVACTSAEEADSVFRTLNNEGFREDIESRIPGSITLRSGAASCRGKLARRRKRSSPRPRSHKQFSNRYSRTTTPNRVLRREHPHDHAPHRLCAGFQPGPEPGPAARCSAEGRMRQDLQRWPSELAVATQINWLFLFGLTGRRYFRQQVLDVFRSTADEGHVRKRDGRPTSDARHHSM